MSNGQTGTNHIARSRKQATFVSRVPVHCITPFCSDALVSPPNLYPPWSGKICHAFYTWASGSDDRGNPIPRTDVNKLIDWLIDWLIAAFYLEIYLSCLSWVQPWDGQQCAARGGREFDGKFLKNVKSPPHALPSAPRRLNIKHTSFNSQLKYETCPLHV